MIYRVSQRTLYRSINTNLGFLTWDMSNLTSQLSSGKKVNKPSDDPAGGASILAMRTVLADVTQYYKDVATSDDWLKTTESVLQSMKETMEQANVLAEQLSNQTYSPANMDVAAEDIDKLFESMIKMGNTQLEDRYAFAGQRTQNQPFANFLTIMDAMADRGNSSMFQGDVVTQGSRTFNYRPDIPPQTQKFIVEITSAGGIATGSMGSSGYSLSRLTIDPAGSHNGLFYTAKDNALYRGSSGNNLNVIYSSAIVQSATTLTLTASAITVNLATSGGQIITTAQDIMDLINHDAVASGMVTVYLAPGNSGTGKVTTTSAMHFAGGYDTTAKYRVSQDGGLTWSVPNAFLANDIRGNNLIYNPQLGHSTLTTKMAGLGNDLHFVANRLGPWGNDISIQFVNDQSAGSALNITMDPAHWQITVHLACSGANRTIITTANDIVSAVNNDPVISNMFTTELANYREGGQGRVTVTERTALSNGNSELTALGFAKYTTLLPYTPPAADPNIEFTSLVHGTSGNSFRLRYSSAQVQSFASFSAMVDTSGYTNITVYLGQDTSGHIISTAQEVVDLFTSAYIHNPGSAYVIANLAHYPQGKTAKLSLLGNDPVTCCLYRTFGGGDNSQDQANHGVNIRFVNDNTLFPGDRSPLQTGDRFEVDVGYYLGDDLTMSVNANTDTHVQLNVTGSEALGHNGADDNILDVLSRLKFALSHHNSQKVAAELPHINKALEKLTTNMSRLGVRLTRNQFTNNVLGSMEENSTQRMSRYEDLDFEEAITSLQTRQTAYQATLAATAMITRLSLVDYIK